MLLVIACGNSLREDDGAGLQLAEMLVAAWQSATFPTRLITVHQLTPELAVELAKPDVQVALFVDSRVALWEGDTAVHFAPIKPAPHTQPFGHTMNPELICYYATELYSFLPTTPVFQLTIPGFRFGHSERLSPLCQEILTHTLNDADRILQLLKDPTFLSPYGDDFLRR